MNCNNENSTAPNVQELIKNATINNYKDALISICGLESEIEKSSLINVLAKQLGVKVSDIEREIRNNLESNLPEVKATFTELVDLVLDDEDQIAYLVKTGKGLEVIRAWTTSDSKSCIPPGREYIQYKLPRASRVIELYNQPDTKLFDDIVTYLKRFSYLPNEVWPLIASWILLSYLQDHKEVLS